MSAPDPSTGPDPRARAARAVAACAPAYRGADLHYLGGGLDHRAFLARDLVVRVAAPAAAADVVREAALLRLVAAHVSIPVPAPRFADPDEGVLAYPVLPGRPLLGRTPPAGAAARLATVLRELHAIDPADVGTRAEVDPAEPDEWLADLTGPAPLLRIVHASRPRPASVLTLAHADLGAEHILEQGGVLTGVIDWADAAVTDPALDFARLHRDFGPAFLDDVLRAYGDDGPGLRERITFFARCAALEDLVYGRESGREEYLRAARRSLAWLFPGAAGAATEPPPAPPAGEGGPATHWSGVAGPDRDGPPGDRLG
ncbi:phosphotransferase [Geodermatophilus sp. CPCC 206100]|uniref:phosphotransferase n=1 Tax=Geodermatophilus sp. CPCC 206100 TaxID=3020054 RepID=UPI003AFF824A